MKIRPNQKAASVRSNASSRRRLCGTVLRSVSRSFYLSIRFLPTPLREPVALAYLQGDAAERALLESLPDCLEWLEQSKIADRDDVRAVLSKITQGQMLDLHRFDNPEEIRTLRTGADLDEYTYLVAGCVGKFWTQLCFRHVPNFVEMSEEEMSALGDEYGKALQLINILRDAGSDLRAGRCY